jgi:hypothetical protein
MPGLRVAPTLRTGLVMLDFSNYVIARRDIEIQKEAGVPWPHGCSIHALIHRRYCSWNREHDAGTRHFAVNWRAPNEHDPDLWIASAVRMRGSHRVHVLERLGYPVPWDEGRFVAVLKSFRRPSERYGNSFTIPRFGCGPKPKGLARLFTGLWNDRDRLRPKPGEPLQAFYQRLKERPGFDPFFAAQVIADIKHAAPYRSAPDWWSFVAPGPGSIKGLNRILGKPINEQWDEDAFAEVVHTVHDQIRVTLADAGIVLDAQGYSTIYASIISIGRCAKATGHVDHIHKEIKHN